MAWYICIRDASPECSQAFFSWSRSNELFFCGSAEGGGWRDGSWLDGWMDKWMDEMVGWWMDGWMGGWIYGQMDRWISGWMDAWMNDGNLAGWRVRRASLVAQSVKTLPAMQETWVQSLGWEDPLEKEMATHSSILAWKISWTKEPGGLQSMGSQRVGHDWATNIILKYFFRTCLSLLGDRELSQERGRDCFSLKLWSSRNRIDPCTATQ